MRFFKRVVSPGFLTILLTAFIILDSGLIPRWGIWYSNHLPHRWQTEDFLHGKVAMASDPSGLFWDSAWGNGSVQQIWGLGVPVWRLLFECLARIFGQPAFPDRIAFCIALAVSTYCLLKFHFTFSPDPETIPAWVWALVASVPTVLFPPFFALCRSRFLVYEEVEAYACLVGHLLAVCTGWICFRPSRLALLCLACLAGIAASVRPTFGAYGAASLIVASIVFWQNGMRLRPILWAGAIFILGNGLLVVSNIFRFGSPFEFGHSLAVNGISAMAYATRFDNPFQNVPFMTAAKELFCLLFFTKNITDGDAYGFGRFSGQAPTLRWRELEFSTFDVTVFLIFTAAWAWLAFSFLRRLKKIKKLPKLDPVESMILWTVISAVPLVAFYLRFPFISSRYLMDFSPMLGWACWASIWLMFRFARSFSNKSPWPKVALCAAAVVWWAFESASLKNNPLDVSSPNRTLSWAEVALQMERDKNRSTTLMIPSLYTNGISFAETGIPMNGYGWRPSGDCLACVIVFLDSPSDIVLEVGPREGGIIQKSDYDCIRVKVGLENLKRENTIVNPRGVQIKFAKPTKAAYLTGIQILSIAMTSAADLKTGNSKFRLFSVESGLPRKNQNQDQSTGGTSLEGS